MNGSPQHINYTAADIQRYHAGEMTAQERHALEKAALDDPFLADALEGYVHTKTAASDIEKIKARLTKKEEAKVVTMVPQRLPWLRIAALFVLIAGGAWLAYRFSFQPQQEVAITQAAKPTNELSKAPASLPSDTTITVDTASDLAGGVLSAPLPQDNTAVATKPVQESQTNAVVLNNRDDAALSLQRSSTDSLLQGNVAGTTEVAPPTAMNHVYSGRKDGFLDSSALNEVVVTKKGKDSLQLDVQMKPAADAEKNMEQRAFNARSKAPERKELTSELLEPAEGWASFNNYVVQNLETPNDLKTKSTGSAEVELTFDVNKEGEPVNIKVVRSLCAACDAEAIRLLKEGPKWKNERRKKGKVTIRF